MMTRTTILTIKIIILRDNLLNVVVEHIHPRILTSTKGFKTQYDPSFPFTSLHVS